MKILLAPAETKNSGGNQAVYGKNNFCFPQLFEKRDAIVQMYEAHVKHLDPKALSAWFGLKNDKEVQKYAHTLLDKPGMKAIQRYNGVAFDALEYDNLTTKAQAYIDKNVVLFSNLFGPILACDIIPDYKYKQGAKLPNISVERYYCENFTDALDNFLGEEVLDLRAGFYEKFYKVKHANVLTFKFIKEGKVVSHWAKHYRGRVLNAVAKHNIQNFSEFMQMQIEGLQLLEIQEKKNNKLLILNIVD
ncbi:YaaA family protein [Candidatus Marinarcus aquaticus]|uniref:Peroxide stress protein YaaA n=1 Tax=Candidatus Marinarcus aquaticus TaxID=2044504 RepID=A0A4Q0XRA7_9BACT|nr:YaaA family protein [Candidatus Marinarcus aquaticus]RXJ58188.1 hypothetical protein CRV04_06680 [Candidatus Marinarcus aquaticus]